MLTMLVKWYIGRKLNTNLQRRKQRLKQEKYEHNQWMVQRFGMGRTILSKLFGSYCLYAFPSKTEVQKPIEQPKDEFTPEYTKFYKDIKVAERYRKMQEKKWQEVRIVEAFDDKQNSTGYFLYAANKIENGG